MQYMQNDNHESILDIVNRLQLRPHPEGGYYAERHCHQVGDGRPASGSIYYYLGPNDRSAFHRIDCGEYWCHTAGDPLELWVISPNGDLCIYSLGLGDGFEPLAYVEPGSVFAAKHANKDARGTLVCCITVPRFEYQGFELVGEAELERLCPQAKAFFVGGQ